MRIWAVVMRKGGTGRTVFTVNLACHAAKLGLTALAINIDAQLPLHSWFKVRLASQIPNDRVQVLSANIGELPFLLREAARQGVNFAIIDTVPYAKREIIEIYRLSDLVLMPVRPASWDIVALRETAGVLSSSNTGTNGSFIAGALDNAIILLNCVDNRNAEAEQAEKALHDMGIRNICKTRISERIEVRKAAALGQGTCEFAPHGKAAAEFAALFSEIIQWHSAAAPARAAPVFSAAGQAILL